MIDTKWREEACSTGPGLRPGRLRPWRGLAAWLLAGLAITCRPALEDGASGPVLQIENRALAPGESFVQPVEMEARQYLRVVVRQPGLDVALTLVDPGGEPVKQVDGAGGPWVEELLSAVAKRPGTYRLEVRAAPAETAFRGFRLKIEELRRALPDDPRRLAAEDLLQRGRHLQEGGSEEAVRRAVAELETASELWRDLGDGGGEAHATRLVGECHHYLGDLAAARLKYQQALALARRADDRGEQARTLNNLGVAERRLGKPELARKLYRQALALADQVADPEIRGGIHSNLATLHDSTGELDEALAHVSVAVELRRAARDLRGEAFSLVKLGGLLVRLGRLNEAMARHREALELVRALGDTRTEVSVLNSLGFLHRSRGAMQEAVDSYQPALRLAEEIGDRGREVVLASNLGEIFELLGDSAAARRLFARALRVSRAMGSADAEALSLMRLGWHHLGRGAPAAALEALELGIPLSRAARNERIESYLLRGTGKAELELGRPKKALAPLQRTLELQQQLEDLAGQAGTLLDLGTVHRQLGDRQAARQCLDRSLSLSRAISDPQREADARSLAARFAEEDGDLEGARREIEASLSLVESLRSQVAGPERRATYLAGSRQDYAFLIDLSLRLERRHPGEGHGVAAFEASERARTRSLVELLAEARVEARRELDPELREQWQEATGRLSWLQKRLIEELSRQTSGEAAQRDLRQRLGDVRLELQEIETRIRRHHPRYAEVRYPQAVGLPQAQALLDDGDALVEYALGEDSSFLFVVTRSGLAVRRLAPAREIVDQARRARAHLQRPGRRTLARLLPALRRLYALLVAPAEDLLAAHQRLVIVPDGELFYLPFEALIDEGETHLLTRWSVAYVPSASVLAGLQSAPRRRRQELAPGVRFVAFADPAMPPDGASGPPQRPSWSWRRLPGSRREAESIGGLFGAGESLLFLGAAATEGSLKRDARVREAEYLHFASHALLDETGAAYAALLLAPGDAEDGLLQLHEVFDLELAAELVVLSGCETALGGEVEGEGLIGLSRAFFYAGAKRTLVTLWQVADRSTAELMADFYARSVAGATTAAALREAKLRQLNSDHRKHPYYWAPFVLVGAHP